MYDKGRHDTHTKTHQAARYHLRAGMAKVALQAKAEGRPAVDSRGTPLRYANEMAQRHNTKTLARWAANRRKTLITV